MVADGEGVRESRGADGGENFVVEGGPHGVDVGGREVEALTCDHVTAANDHVRLPAGKGVDAFDDFSTVVGGAVGTVEIADDDEANVTARGGKVAVRRNGRVYLGRDRKIRRRGKGRGGRGGRGLGLKGGFGAGDGADAGCADGETGEEDEAAAVERHSDLDW